MGVVEPTRQLPELPAAFDGVSPAVRARLLGSAVRHTTSAGTVLFEQGDTPNFQQIVLSGSVQLLARSASGAEVLVESVQPCELVLPAAVMTAAPYLMRGRTPEPTELLMIHAEAFRAAAAAEPALAMAVIASLAAQFRRMVRQIKNLKLRTAKERTGCYLLALSARQGSPDRAVLPFEKSLIASELGMSRESFSRALAALRRHGVSVDGPTVKLRDRAGLAAACRPDPLIDGEDGLAAASATLRAQQRTR